MSETVLVLGASNNPDRYAWKAAQRLVAHGHKIVLVGKRSGEVSGISILQTPPKDISIDTVTVYLNPSHQKQYYDYLLALNPKRIIFNPGTENQELAAIAQNSGIATEEACTLVLLSTGSF
ncbi:MAG: CoA-binding protein [Flavobacteriales bacterium]|nr:CoA-binding protein [Flavobacteriales bacterium]